MSDDIKIYESIINKELSEFITKAELTKSIHKDPLEAATSGTLLASYIQGIVENGLRHFRKPEDLPKQIEIANELIKQFQKLIEDDGLNGYEITENHLLRGMTEKMMRRDRFNELMPQTSVAKSNLFTGGQYEPPVYSELKREIASAQRVDLLVSFIKHSGLRLIYDDLVEHTKTKQLRVITTSYMGASDYKAIKMLADLPNTEVRISYDTNRTRLHAKAYYFHRDTGFSTAYIGSSNLSKAALSEGTEWNMKVSEYSSPEIIQKYRITFETYWNIQEFQRFDPQNIDDLRRLKVSLEAEGNHIENEQPSYFFDIVPYAYQKEILERLEVEREVFNSNRNLIVAATGTGKTIVSAFDFKQFYQKNPATKLLFIAHREEILKQSLNAFRGVLKDANFGELWVGGQQPTDYQHVFASIATLNSNDQFLNFEPTNFNYIVLDETHHSAAVTYKKIINYFTPQILLGLTATPERLDGANVLEDFNNRIAYEIRLKEAIERNLLCPFHYFGVSDDTDLSAIKWQNGRYEIEGLNTQFIGNLARDLAIIRAIDKYVSSRENMKGLGFCASIEHARYMSKSFNEKGIPSISLDSGSPPDVRSQAKSSLVKGEIKFIFVVDLYNEGVDIREINTVLFLRPTESPTIFIQQLGRGLRLHESKDVLTVLDFIGQANKQYNFRMKYQALVGRTHHAIKDEIEMDFPTIPRNCCIKLERIAKERILKNISLVYTDIRRLRQMVLQFEQSSLLPLNLTNFLKHYGLIPLELYKSTTLVELKSKTNVIDPDSPLSSVKALNKMFYRIAKIDSLEFLTFINRLFQSENEGDLPDHEGLKLMLYYTLFSKPSSQPLDQIFGQMKCKNPEIVAEIIELVQYNLQQIDHLPKHVVVNENTSLELHASYSMDQALAALGHHTAYYKKEFREGVLYLLHHDLDIFFITLNKSEKHFKESTRYEDYAMNESLFHWQSQSRTTDKSKTGQRYIQGHKQRSRVILFVREEKTDAYRATETFRCLGFARYSSHEGSAPISIIYKLEEKMPMKLLRTSNQVVDII